MVAFLLSAICYRMSERPFIVMASYDPLCCGCRTLVRIGSVMAPSKRGFCFCDHCGPCALWLFLIANSDGMPQLQDSIGDQLDGESALGPCRLPGSLTLGTQFTPLKTIAILLQGSRASWRHARLLLTVVVLFLLTAHHRQCWARARLVRSDCRVVDECVLTYAAAELEVAPGGAFLLSTRFRSALTLRASRTRCVTKSYASPQFRWSAGAYFRADQGSVFETCH